MALGAVEESQGSACSSLACADSSSRIFSFYINYLLLKDSQEANDGSPVKQRSLRGKRSKAPIDRLQIEVGTNPDLPTFLDALQGCIPRILKDLGFEQSSKKQMQERGVCSIAVTCSALDVNKFFRLNSLLAAGASTDSSEKSIMPVSAESLDARLRRAVRALLPSRIEEALKVLGISGVMVKSPEHDVQELWTQVWARNSHAAVVPWLFTATHRVQYALANQATYLSDCRVKGLIRPWTLLVSMHPERRRIIAVALEIPVSDTYGFNPAAEAHEILLAICQNSVWRSISSDSSKQNDNPWLKILICETGRWPGIDTPDDLLRLDRPANFSLARERSNRADDRSEPGRMERLLLLHELGAAAPASPGAYLRLPGSMEGLEALCERETLLEADLEKHALREGDIRYDAKAGWINCYYKNWMCALLGRLMLHTTSVCCYVDDSASSGTSSIQTYGVVKAILHQRLVLAYENVDFGNLIKEASD